MKQLIFTIEEIKLLERLDFLFKINHPDFAFSINAQQIFFSKPEIKAKIPPMLGEEAAIKRLKNNL